MALSVATNTSAATAHRYLKTNDMEASRSLAKLASGSRIVRASDDAASLAVGTKLKADVNALRQAQVNASHGSSVLQVADGALQQVSDILIRMKALATQATLLHGSVRLASGSTVGTRSRHRRVKHHESVPPRATRS